MRKLLLFLMLLIAAAPPLLAQDYTFDFNPIRFNTTPNGSALEVEVPITESFSLTITPKLGDDVVTDGELFVPEDDEHFSFLWYYFEFEIEGNTITFGTQDADEGKLEGCIIGWKKDDYVAYFTYDFMMVPAQEATIEAPVISVATDLNKEYYGSFVFLKSGEATVTLADNPEGTQNYYYVGDDALMTEVANADEADYTIEEEKPKLGTNGFPLLTYEVWNSDCSQQFENATLEDINETHIQYEFWPTGSDTKNPYYNEEYADKKLMNGVPELEKSTIHYKRNESAVEINETGTVPFTPTENSVKVQAVALNDSEFILSQAQDLVRFAPTAFATIQRDADTNAPSDVDITGTEAAPYDFVIATQKEVDKTDKYGNVIYETVDDVQVPVKETVTVYSYSSDGPILDVVSNFSNMQNWGTYNHPELNDLGVKLCYTVTKDGTPSETQYAAASRIDLSSETGTVEVSAWYAKATEDGVDENIVSEPINIWVKLMSANAVAPYVPQFKKGIAISGSVREQIGTAITLTCKTADVTYLVTMDGEPVDYDAETGIVFDKIGTFELTAKAVHNGVESEEETLTVEVYGANAPQFYLNTNANDPAGDHTINAFVGDNLILHVFENCGLSYTVNGENATELTVDNEHREFEIALNEAGTFEYVASTWLESYPNAKVTMPVTVNVLATPTVTINEESGAVEITSDENATTYWAIMLPDGDVDSEEAIAALKYEEVGTEAIEPETPGYIFVYSEAPLFVEVEGEDPVTPTATVINPKSAYVGGETAKYAISTEGLKLTLRLPEAYYDETNLSGVKGIYFNKVEAGEQVEFTLVQEVEKDGETTYVSFPEYGELEDFALVDVTGTTFEGNVLTASFAEGGVYDLKATWSSEWYRNDNKEVEVTLNVFAVISNSDIEGGTAEDTELENGDIVNFITIEETATAVTFPVPEDGYLWYRVISIPKAEQAEGIRGKILARADEERTPGEDIAGFTKSEDGTVALDGNSGSILTITETKEGITSPISQYYYGTEADREELLKDITTGVIAVGVDAEGVEYYDLNGLRVNGNELKAGIYVRVANGKATKVVVK